MRFAIKHSDGTTIYEGKPKYNGIFGKPSYIEFSEIASDHDLGFVVGDYVDYTRTGFRYKLYSIPQVEKHANKESRGDDEVRVGGAFIYKNVQFYAPTKDLEVALFRDIVENDNYVHFSSLAEVSTYEDVYGIAARIKANLDNAYGSGVWNVTVINTNDAELDALLHEVRQFSVSDATCMDALNQIYTIWRGIGWVYSEVNGVHTITLGKPNVQSSDNTTDVFAYGRNNGLKVVAKAESSRNEFATRVYAYGSDRNMPSRYYNQQGIKNAQSVYIPHLMLPLDDWGGTPPDASQAYIESDLVDTYGVVPKVLRFDGSSDYPDIYPSIEGMTAWDADLLDHYSGDTRLDEVFSCANPTDNGMFTDDSEKVIAKETIEFDAIEEEGKLIAKQQSVTIGFEPLLDLEAYTQVGRCIITPFAVKGYISSVAQYVLGNPIAKIEIKIDGKVRVTKDVKTTWDEDGTLTFDVPEIAFECTEAGKDMLMFIRLEANTVYTKMDDPEQDEIEYTASIDAGKIQVSFEYSIPTTFNVTILNIGFDISSMGSAITDGLATLNMKDGDCAGRDFRINKCEYDEDNDRYVLQCQRQEDTSISQWFPNSIYQIESGDHFVLTDLQMPELYVEAAMERLHNEAVKALNSLSKRKMTYIPTVDSKAVYVSEITLLEGMYMPIEDDDLIGTEISSSTNTTWVLIDSMTIAENEDAIPIWSVTLRDEKTESMIQKISGEVTRGNRFIKELQDKDKRKPVTDKNNDGDPNAFPKVYIESATPFFVYDEDDSLISDPTILLTAVTEGINKPAFQWYWLSALGWEELEGADKQTYSVSADSLVYFQNNERVEDFRVVATDADETEYEARIMIAKVYSGNGYMVSLNNPVHIFPAEDGHAVEGSDTIGIIAYRGKNKIDVSIGTIRGDGDGIPEGMTATVGGTALARTITVEVTEDLMQTSGKLIIPVSVMGDTPTPPDDEESEEGDETTPEPVFTIDLEYSWSLLLVDAMGQGVFKSIVFKRSTTTPDTPTGGSYQSSVPLGWSDGVPAGTAQMWMSTRVFTSNGEAPQTDVWTTPKAVTDTAEIDFEFSAVAENPGDPTDNPDNWHNTATVNDIWMAIRLASNGVWGEWEVMKVRGENGAAGLNGYNQAIIYLYRRSTTPIEDIDWTEPLTYTFETEELNPVPANWSRFIPEGEGTLYVTGATASARGVSDTITAGEWAAPTSMAEDGTDGLNSATVTLYQRKSSIPTIPRGPLTYTFETGILSGTTYNFNGWSQVFPEDDGNPCYVITATAISASATDTITTDDWSGVRKLVKDGEPGENGYNNAIINLYKRSSAESVSVDWTSTIRYQFAQRTLSPIPTGWSRTIPTDSTDPIWVTMATANAKENYDDIEYTEWSEPVMLAENGLDGINCATVFLYQRGLATSTPSKPQGDLTYTFATGDLSGTTTSFNGWSQLIPAADGRPLYFIQATAASAESTDVLRMTEWSDVKVLMRDGEPGTPGTNGYNNCTIILYKRSATPITQISFARMKYNFVTDTLSTIPTGWSRTIPDDDDGYPCYATSAHASSQAEEDWIESNEWSTPVELVKNGEDGEPGIHTAALVLYQRNVTKPTVKPQSTLHYIFASGQYDEDDDLGDWNVAIPNDDGTPCWYIHATAIGTGTQDDITPGEWSSVEKFVESGKSAYYLDLSNENMSVNADNSGNIKSGGYRPSSIAKLYLGTSPQTTGVTYSVSVPSGTYGVSINGSTGLITLHSTQLNFSTDSTEITVNASVGGSIVASRVLNISKSKDGDDGTPATSYEIRTSVNQIVANKVDESSYEPVPGIVTATEYKYVGASDPVVSTDHLKRYTFIQRSNGQRLTNTTSFPTSGLEITSNMVRDYSHLLVGLYTQGGSQWSPTYTLFAGEEESIPLLINGKDGEDGEPGQPGDPGEDGYSTATIYLYKRATSAPTTAPGNTTYNFANGTLSLRSGASWNGWVKTPAETGSKSNGPIWVIQTSVSSRDESVNINGGFTTSPNGAWTSPIQWEGDKGDSGTNAGVKYLYRRSQSAPTAQPGQMTYTFTTRALSPSSALNGWSETIPTDTTYPLYFIVAYPSGDNATVTIPAGWGTNGGWTVPARVTGEDGLVGKIMRGVNEWTTTFTPTGGWQGMNDTDPTHRFYDVVRYNNKYYYLTDGTKGSQNPATSEYWVEANNFEFIATKVLIASNAFVDVFSGNKAYMYDSDGETVVAGMQGESTSGGETQVNFFAGTTSENQDPMEAPFRVHSDGKLVATDAEIRGTVHADEGEFSAAIQMPYLSITNSLVATKTNNKYYITQKAKCYIVCDYDMSFGSDYFGTIYLPTPSADYNGVTYHFVIYPMLTSSDLAGVIFHSSGGSKIFDFTHIGVNSHWQYDEITAQGGLIQLTCIPNGSSYNWAIISSTCKLTGYIGSTFYSINDCNNIVVCDSAGSDESTLYLVRE